MAVPSGTVTFLFTDIEGSTQLWETAPDAMRAALERHDAIVRAAIDNHGGYVFATGGDGFAAAFSRAGDAVGAGVEAQQALAAEPWPKGAPIPVRMAVHTGEVTERAENYFGPAVNQTARLMAIGHHGQLLCSAMSAGLLGSQWPLVDLGEHRLRDLSAPQRVFQVGQGRYPPLRSVDAVPGNLPTVRTELIGRSADIAALSGLVEREPLVTLAGTGGVGKTRLALGVAAALAPGFPDGGWLVELAPVSDGGEVAKTVASTIGATITDVVSLARYLSDRRMLIVLDNCEHVLADAAHLVDAVLSVAPEMRVLVTSREPLGVDGEQVRRVQSLAVPTPDATVEEAVASPAARLFTRRAASVSERFAIVPGNVAAVVEICRHLDGIPLAIELAAARASAMPAAEIAARLGERFRLLAGGSRRGQERHRTLMAAVSWSHDLLDDDERVVFRRLAVFPATFDIAAAEAVAGGDEGLDVLDTLVRLVGRSMVQYDPDEGRYRLLETLRQYGADRLVDAGEMDDTLGRHGRHFLGVVERIAPELDDARYPGGTAVLTLELENLRAVARWCIDSDRWTELAEMGLRLWTFVLFSAPVDGMAWYSAAIEHGDAVKAGVVADVLAQSAYLAGGLLGDYPLGIALAERSLLLAEREVLLPSPWAWLTKTLVAYWTTIGDPEGLRACEQAIAAAEARHDEFATVATLGMRGYWLSQFGDADQGALILTEALRRAERTGQPSSIQMAMSTAAGSHLWHVPRPDFAASLAILDRYDKMPHLDDAAGMIVDYVWGATLVGLHRGGAVGRLARAVRAADRLRSPGEADLVFRIFAIAVAEAGYQPEAATLAGYAEANLRQHRLDAPGYAWLEAALDEALAGMMDRAAHSARGAGSTRRQIMALVEQVDATAGTAQLDRSAD